MRRDPYSPCDLCVRYGLDSQRNLGTGDLGDHASLFLCDRGTLCDLGDSHNPAYTRDRIGGCGKNNSYHVWEHSQLLVRQRGYIYILPVLAERGVSIDSDDLRFTIPMVGSSIVTIIPAHSFEGVMKCKMIRPHLYNSLPYWSWTTNGPGRDGRDLPLKSPTLKELTS